MKEAFVSCDQQYATLKIPFVRPHKQMLNLLALLNITTPIHT